MTCEEFEELSGAYALDAVTPAERQAAAAHLANCARCRSLLRDLNGVVELLPLAVAPVQPRAVVWERIGSALQPDKTAPIRRPGPALRRVSRRQWTAPVLAVAAVLLFGLLSGMTAWNLSLMQKVTSLEHLTHAPTQQPASVGVLTSQVAGTNPAQGVRGEVLSLPQQHLTLLILHGLPPPQGQQVYQGWLLHLHGQEITGATSIGLLNLVHDTASISFSGDVLSYDAIAVSLEPGPMATPKAPQGKVVAFGTLKQAP